MDTVIEVGESEREFLSNEPVEGELLAERLARGGLSAEEALHYAIEIGVALNRAHSHGLVHGALSPDSIAITSAGARVLQPHGQSDRTAPYRAPEQVRGGAPDSRSDVFAYGAVLYEMASGRRAFPGEGAGLDEAILRQAPAALLAKLPIHAAMEGVIAGCLEKDPAHRRQRVQNAVIELKLAGRSLPRVGETLSQPRRATPPASTTGPSVERMAPAEREAPVAEEAVWVKASKVAAPPAFVEPAYAIPTDRFRRRFWMIGISLVALAATSLAAVLYLHQRPAAPVLKFAVTQPEHTSYPGMPAVSPDGRYLTFSAVGPEGKRMLWLRPLDALHATVLQGTEGGFAPFWSPDSQVIAFFANKSLKKVRVNIEPEISAGPAETICPAEAMAGGGTWNAEGTILFSPSLADGLYRVAASGGKAQPVLKLDSAKFERSHAWPQFLPDGKHFVFYVLTDLTETSGVYAGTLDPPEHHRLFVSETNAVFSGLAGGDSTKSGYLLFMRDRNLMGQSFNLARLAVEGEPRTLADDIGAVLSLSLAPISVSRNAILVYQGVGKPTRQMVWTDRGGRQIRVAGEPGEWGPPRVAPDGNRGVVAKLGPDGKNAHLWIVDTNGGATQLTDSPAHEGSPVWSPDGLRVAFFSTQEGSYNLYVRPVGAGGKTDLLLKSTFRKFPTDWSHDGRYILFGVTAEGTWSDVWAISTADRHAAPILDTVNAEGYAALSPDGKWLAFQSDESGRNEVYVQPFDGLTSGTKRRWQISKGGGGLPRWRADGKEVYYITADGRMMAAGVHPAEGDFGAEAPQVLFQTRPVPKTWNLYDVSPDGQRFLLNLPLEWSSSAPITVVTNWTEKLKD